MDLFDEESIRALSKLGRSTKRRLDSVGFMGVGFKSVFQRVRRVEVVDPDLRMCFLVGEDSGVLGTKLRRSIDLVLPRWDDSVEAPSAGFRTRFSLSVPIDARSFLDDVEQLVPSNVAAAPDALALLALRGLERLEVNGREWLLQYQPEKGVASVLAGDVLHEWFVARHAYRPSRDALRRLIEYRRILITSEEDPQLARDREVVALVPLDEDGVPHVPRRGRVFATLPTGVELDVPFLLQADWLLEVSRQDLVHPPSDAWQRDIVEQIPAVVGVVVRWLADCARSGRPEVLAAGLRVLEGLDAASKDLGGALAAPEIRRSLGDTLRGIPFVPARDGKDAELARPIDVHELPTEMASVLADTPNLSLGELFGSRVVDPALAVTRPALLCVLRDLQLLKRLELSALRSLWPGAIQAWWTRLQSREEADGVPAAQREVVRVMVRLLAAIQRLGSTERGWYELRCVPTAGDAFVPPKSLHYYKYPMPPVTEPFGALLAARLPAVFLDPNTLIHPSIESATAPTATVAKQEPNVVKDAVELMRRGQAVIPHERIRDAIRERGASIEVDVIVELARWALGRISVGAAQGVEFVVVAHPDGDRVVPTRKALLAAPFVEGGDCRKTVFPSRHPISPTYVRQGDSARTWREFFEKIAGVAGNVALDETSEPISRWNKEGFRARVGADAPQCNDDGYWVWDWRWPPEVEIHTPGGEFSRWLEGGFTALLGKGTVVAEYSYYGGYSLRGTAPSAWRLKLEQTAWVPTDSGRVLAPKDVVLARDVDEQPLARISRDLAKALEQEGVRFGTAVARPTPIARLQSRGSLLDAQQLAALLVEARAFASTDAQKAELRDVVRELPVTLASGARIPGARIVKEAGGGRRSDLRGFVARITDVLPALQPLVVDLLGGAMPDTTTGGQALLFLKHVWASAEVGAVSPEIRRTLPTAYGYLCADIDSVTGLRAEFERVRPLVRVAEGATWHSLDQELVIDDLHDPDLRALVPTHRSPSASHLGERPADVARTARILGIPLLSVVLAPETQRGPEAAPPWLPRLDRVCRVLGTIEGRDTMRVAAHETLGVVARGRRFPRFATVEGDTLRVAGRPVDFACDATERIVSHYRLEQRGGDVPALTKVLLKLDDDAAFELAFDAAVRQLNLDEDAVAAIAGAPAHAGAAATSPTGDSGDHVASEGALDPKDDSLDGSERDDSVSSAVGPLTDATALADGRQGEVRATSGSDEPVACASHGAPDAKSEGSTATRADPDQPRATVGALQSETSGHGEGSELYDEDDIDVEAHTRRRGSRSGRGGEGPPRAGYGYGTPANKDADLSADETNEDGEGEGDNGDDDNDDTPAWPDNATGPDARRRYVVADPRASRRKRLRDRPPPNDGPARAAVVAFERARGRQPKVMGDKHEGYDVESSDPATGHIRRIEIKTIAGIWRDQASVYLSEPQFRAGAMNRDPGLEHWLYVVDAHRIYPVPWRSIGVARFFFYAEDWAELAEDVGERDGTASEHASPDAASEPETDEALFEPDWWPAVTAMREANLLVTAGTDVVDAGGRVTGQTVAVASRAGLEVIIIDDDSREADATARAVAETGAAFIRTCANRAARDVQRWFDEQAG